MNSKAKIFKEAKKVIKRQGLYALSTSLAKKENVKSADDDFSLEYAKQAVEIGRLLKNDVKLYRLSKKVSYETFTKIRLVTDNTADALEVYRRGLDNADFDKKIKQLNDFIDSHIVIRKKKLAGHFARKRKTFRLITSEDMLKNEFDENGEVKSKSQRSFEKGNELSNFNNDIQTILNQGKNL